MHRILIVDDNRDAADGLTRLLRSVGHHVETAYDGVSALQVIETVRPTIVLLDIAMPGMDGYRVASELRKRSDSDGFELIALTGFDSAEHRQRAEAAGFDQGLTKPVEINELLALINAVERHRRGPAR
jgi:DNA-binding response OmpR family regulator